MSKRIALTAPLLLLVPSFCHAQALTLAEADTIIVVLSVVVIVLLVLGGFGLHYNRVISRRNEQLLRILNALDDYRAIVAEGATSRHWLILWVSMWRRSASWFHAIRILRGHLIISTLCGRNTPQRYNFPINFFVFSIMFDQTRSIFFVFLLIFDNYHEINYESRAYFR